MLESGGNAVTLRFHDRLTVIAGVGRAERESLVTELTGALNGTRRGTHLELVDDRMRRLAFLRPEGGRDRVLDIEHGAEVTELHLGEDGRIDVLREVGLTPEIFRRRARLSAADMASLARADIAIERLAGVDQDALWQAADRVRDAEAILRREAEAAGAAAEDAPVIEEIERRHRVFEAAQARLESVRHHGIFVGGACVLAAGASLALDSVAALGFLLVAVATTLTSIIYRRRMEKARKAERRALAEAGAESYVGFHLQRINALMSREQDRRRLADAAVEHRQALEHWRSLAGELGVDWAMAKRQQVEAAARRLAERTRRPSVGTGIAGIEPAELAHALIIKLNELRHAGARGESIPLILDEPLAGLLPSVKQWLLELVGRSAGSPQVIYLTDDPDVAAWARMESLSGELGFIEPAPESESSSDVAR